MAELITRYVKLGIAWILVIVLIVVYNNVSCRQVKGLEMEPTILRESYRLIFPAKYKPHEHIQYEDIVYFEYDQAGQPQSEFAARVLGMPGDRIWMDKGEVFRNGTRVDSGYVGTANKVDDAYEEIIVPRSTFFVLMDARRQGAWYDSRAIGPVGMYALGGKVRQ